MPRRIAIIEDEQSISENLSDALTRHGYEVTTYADRPSAQEGLDGRLPDLAIIDVGLGDEPEGGFELCRWLRGRAPGLPILILSARDSEIDIVSGLRLGADDYVTKNVSLPHLLARDGAVPPGRPGRPGERRRGRHRARAAASQPAALRGELEWHAGAAHRHRVLDAACPRAPSGPREGPRCADARGEHGGRRPYRDLVR